MIASGQGADHDGAETRHRTGEVGAAPTGRPTESDQDHRDGRDRNGGKVDARRAAPTSAGSPPGPRAPGLPEREGRVGRD